MHSSPVASLVNKESIPRVRVSEDLTLTLYARATGSAHVAIPFGSTPPEVTNQMKSLLNSDRRIPAKLSIHKPEVLRRKVSRLVVAYNLRGSNAKDGDSPNHILNALQQIFAGGTVEAPAVEHKEYEAYKICKEATEKLVGKTLFMTVCGILGLGVGKVEE